MSSQVDHNRALLRRYLDGIYGDRDVSVIDEVFGDIERIQWSPNNSVHSREELKAHHRQSLETVVDIDYEIHTILADDTEAMARWTFECRLVEEFMSITPTGHDRSFEVVTVGHVKNGRLVDIADRYDRRKLLSPEGRIVRSSILQHMRDGVVVLDNAGEIADVNPTALDVFDADRFAVAGEPASELFGPDVALPDAGETTEFSIDDGRRVFELSASAIRNDEGESVGRMLLLHDVTERQWRNRQLQVLNRVLRHNLRNALTTILGRAEYVTDAGSDSDDAELEHAGETILGTGNRLAALSEKVQRVEDVFSTDQAVTDQDLVAALGAVTSALRDEYPGVSLETSLPDSASVRATGSLQFALEALVENACEYNDASDPCVEIAVESVERDRGTMYQIHVSDNGPGIPDQELDVLERDEETPLVHGSGLGLWLAYWTVVLSGGDLRFADNDPRGTVVTVALPAADSGGHGHSWPDTDTGS